MERFKWRKGRYVWAKREREREREKGGDEQGKEEVSQVMYASHMGSSQTEMEYYSIAYFVRASPSSTHCSAELPLRAGLRCTL